MTIYEIDRELEALLQGRISESTGELIIDTEVLAQIEALTMEREKKIENIGCYIKNLSSDSAALEAEIKSLTARRKVIDGKISRLREYLTTVLNGQKFESARCVISWRKSERTETDPMLLPKKWWRRVVTTEPDKESIKAAIKAGKTIKGAELITAWNMQIK